MILALWTGLALAGGVVQVRLLDADGAPLAGEHAVVARWVDAELGGSALGEVLVHAALADGFVSVALPEVEAAALWLELLVDGAPLAPRHPVEAGVAAVAHRVVPSGLSWRGDAWTLPGGGAAASCAAYLAHPAWAGQDWEPFLVDPDGAGAGLPMVLTCDMHTDGGGWAVWEAPGGPWGWDRDGRMCYDLTLFTAGQLDQMRQVGFTEHDVETDVDFWFQEDDSANPGAVVAMPLSALTSAFQLSQQLVFDFTTTSNDHVHLTWAPGADRLLAACSGPSTACGQRNVPANGASTAPLLITRILANPSCAGATAYQNTWSRNASAFQGSVYRVRLR